MGKESLRAGSKGKLLMPADVWLGKCQLFRKALGVTLKTASVTDVTFSKGYCKIFPKTEHISKASSVC